TELKERAKVSLPVILRQFGDYGPADFWEDSPYRLLDSPENDWRLLLQLFKPSDVVWCGSKYDSCADDAPEACNAKCLRHFLPVADWLKSPVVPGQFTCPSTFRNDGIHSRSNQNVIAIPFLVVESDCHSKSEICAIFQWCTQFMRLRAIVD